MISKPSKSARKRDYLALQALGEQLIDLAPEQLDAIALDDQLRDAVVAVRTIRTHGALRRQKQLIGKLMRNVDPEPIRAALHELGADDRRAKQLFRDAERWRDRLVRDPDDALQAFAAYTGRENRELADAIRDYETARSDRSAKTAKRQIFRQVHAEIERKMQKHTRNS